jgi:hypothetical protein
MDVAGITRYVTVITIIVVLVALTGIAYYRYNISSKNNPESQTNNRNITSSIFQIISPLAYRHWTAIGQKNVSAIMSGYTDNYEALWWFVNGSNFLNIADGRYDCNIPTGNSNCSEDLRAVWEVFAENTPQFDYTICNVNFTLGIQTRAFAMATLWYVSPTGNETIKVPLETDFELFNNQWELERDWFGMPGIPVLILPGNVTPHCGS